MSGTASDAIGGGSLPLPAEDDLFPWMAEDATSSTAPDGSLERRFPWMRAVIDEEINRGGTMTLDILVEEENSDPFTMLNKSYRVVWPYGGGQGEVRAWTGTVTRVEFAGRIVHPRVAEDRPWFRVRCEPDVVTRMRAQRTRAFIPVPDTAGLTPPQLLQFLLQEAGQDTTKGNGVLDGISPDTPYPAATHALQWQETDFHFLCGTAEYFGISFFWTADLAPSVEALKGSTLRFVDGGEGFPDGGTAEVRMRAGGAPRDLAIRAARLSATLGLGETSASGWDPSAPDMTVEGSGKASDQPWPLGPGAPSAFVGQRVMGVQADWTENGGSSKQAAWVNRLAQMRLVEESLPGMNLEGVCNISSFAPGQVVDLTGIAAAVPGARDGKRLLTKLRHLLHSQRGIALPDMDRPSPGPSYRNSFSAVPHVLDAGKLLTFRPRRRSVHRVNVFTRAQVTTSTKGQKTPDLDEAGRYLVAFPFAMEGVTPTGQASQPPPGLRMPLLEAFAGAPTVDKLSSGTHLPLRPGANVLIGFQEGDGGLLPFVAGALPDPKQPSPVNKDKPMQHLVRSYSGVTWRVIDGE